jgi:hypothetical protein
MMACGIKSCHHAGLFYTGQVRLNGNLMRLAVLALALAVAGCSGLHQSGSVSPLDFFLPGAGHFLKADPTPTNSPALFPQNPTEIASTK